MGRIATALFISLTLFSCKKDKFGLESEWLTPIVSTEISINDLLDDSLLDVNSDNSLDLSYNYRYDLSGFRDLFTVPDRIDTMEVSLESLVLEDRAFTDTLTLAELYPASILLHGTSTVLDPQDVTTSEGTVIDVTEEFFTTATFIEGYIDIFIHNDLPVEAELIEFELLNEADQSVIVQGQINNLLPFTSDSSSYSLAGKTVDGLMRMQVKKIKTKGSSGPVLIDAYKGLRTEFYVRDLKPQSATAIFPAQNLVERKDETEYFFGGPWLTRLIVETGDILIKVESSIEESIIIDYRIPKSYRNNQTEIIEKTWTIPPAEPGEKVYVEERFPIDGFDISLQGESPDWWPFYNHIYNELIARIEYSGIERSLSLDDKISIEFGLVDVVPYLVTGDPSNHIFDFKDTFDIPLFKNVNGAINLEEATFNMDIENTFGIETLLTVNEIKGVNTRTPKTVNLSSPLIDSILVDRAVNGATTFYPAYRSVVLNKSNSTLKQFIENVPDQIIPDLTLNIRPFYTIDFADFAFNYSDFKVDFGIDVPMHVGLDSFTITRTEEISQLFDNQRLDNLKSINLKAKVKNGFPIESYLTLDFIDESGAVVKTIFAEGTNRIDGAELDETTGKAVGFSESVLQSQISEAEYLLIKNCKEVRVNARFDTESAKRVKLYSDYTINFKLISDFIYEN